MPTRSQHLGTALVPAPPLQPLAGAAWAAAWLLAWAAAAAGEPQTVALTDPLPYGQSPIDYLGPEGDDAVRRLNARLEAGEVELASEGRHGRLASLLEALDVPVESQVLVFSKTALNPQLVGPKSPRAVYFNDEVYVGWVPGAAALEVSAVDPVKGAVFYTLRQDDEHPPRLVRESRCIACHVGETTLHVPGPIVRSFVTDAAGKPLHGWSRITHETELAKRFGGWYVTGTHGRQTHCGNVAGLPAVERHRDDPSIGGNVTDLSPFFETDGYLSPHSDLTAHLVLNHQAHGQNLLTRVGYEARLGRRSDAEERLVRYLLFLDEAPLTAPVRGTSRFAEDFESRGGHGPGPSLRAFDLRTRLFRHRLSYLIDTPSFAGLPEDVRRRLLRRMRELLEEAGPEPEIGNIPADERARLAALLRRREAAGGDD